MICGQNAVTSEFYSLSYYYYISSIATVSTFAQLLFLVFSAAWDILFFQVTFAVVDHFSAPSGLWSQKSQGQLLSVTFASRRSFPEQSLSVARWLPLTTSILSLHQRDWNIPQILRLLPVCVFCGIQTIMVIIYKMYKLNFHYDKISVTAKQSNNT